LLNHVRTHRPRTRHMLQAITRIVDVAVVALILSALT
jgi:hypothetical protein